MLGLMPQLRTQTLAEVSQHAFVCLMSSSEVAAAVFEPAADSVTGHERNLVMKLIDFPIVQTTWGFRRCVVDVAVVLFRMTRYRAIHDLAATFG